MSTELTGKVAIVTAGSSGFGRGIAVAFAGAGARVVIGDIIETTASGNFDESPSLCTVDLIAQQGGEAVYQTCDVSRQDQVDELIEGAVSRFGKVDILVNNAGIYRGGAQMHNLTIEDVDACWNVIVKGTWYASQAAVRHFLTRGEGGNIINLVSTAGLRGHAMQAPYNMAKAAQANLTRCLAIEYAAQNIRANGICPTYVKTAMSRGGFESEMRDRVLDVIPLHRWGEISDVVNAALFLASDTSTFLTGIMLPVDGGETLGGQVEP